MSTSVAVTHAQDVRGARAKIYSILCSAAQPNHLCLSGCLPVRTPAQQLNLFRPCALAYQCAKWQSGSPCSRWHFACTEMCLISIQSNFDNELPVDKKGPNLGATTQAEAKTKAAIALTSTHTHTHACRDMCSHTCAQLPSQCTAFALNISQLLFLHIPLKIFFIFLIPCLHLNIVT